MGTDPIFLICRSVCRTRHADRSRTRQCHQAGVESKREGSGSFARTPAKHGDSKLRRLACGMGLERLLSERIELSGAYVCFKLPIPRFGIEGSEPFPQPCQLFFRELLDLLLDLFHLAHGHSIAVLR